MQVQPFLAQHAGLSTGSGSQAPPAAALQQALPPHLDFSDSSQVFSTRSTGDLLRMYAVLKVRARCAAAAAAAGGTFLLLETASTMLPHSCRQLPSSALVCFELTRG